MTSLTFSRAGLLYSAIAATLAACQTPPAAVSHTDLREYLRKHIGAPLQTVAEDLRARGFSCERSQVDWAAGRANVGCSRHNFDGKEPFGTRPAEYSPLYFLNVELVASSAAETLLSYRTFESRDARYGKR
jgi:hypothetical protein